MKGRANFIVVASSVCLMASLVSCSSGLLEQTKKESGTSSQPATTTKNPEPDVEARLTGLPSSCHLVVQSTAGNFCVICKPRSLEIEHCFESRGLANVDQACSYTDEAVTCKDDDGKELAFMTKPNLIENAFEILPMVTQAARGFIQETLKENEAKWAIEALDFVNKWATDIFKGTNTKQVADDLVVAVTKHATNLSTAQKESLRKVSEKGLIDLGQFLRDGKIRHMRLVNIGVEVLAGLPFDHVGSGTRKIDLKALRELLSSEEIKSKPIPALLEFFKIGNAEELMERFGKQKSQEESQAAEANDKKKEEAETSAQ
jgi:hypothetical protein